QPEETLHNDPGADGSDIPDGSRRSAPARLPKASPSAAAGTPRCAGPAPAPAAAAPVARHREGPRPPGPRPTPSPREGRHRRRPLTAPATSPAFSWRGPRTSTLSGPAITSTVAAITRGHAVVASPCRLRRAICTVRTRSSLVTRRGHRYVFHVVMNVNTARV